MKSEKNADIQKIISYVHNMGFENRQIMLSSKPFFGFVFLLLGGIAVISNVAQNGQSQLETSDYLFKAGKFVEAEKLYAEVLAANPANFQAAFR